VARCDSDPIVLCASHVLALCKNGRTDRGPVWGGDFKHIAFAGGHCHMARKMVSAGNFAHCEV